LLIRHSMVCLCLAENYLNNFKINNLHMFRIFIYGIIKFCILEFIYFKIKLIYIIWFFTILFCWESVFSSLSYLVIINIDCFVTQIPYISLNFITWSLLNKMSPISPYAVSSVGQLDNLIFWTLVQNPVQNLSKTKTFFHWTDFGQITWLEN
jgi:hypothetical protein